MSWACCSLRKAHGELLNELLSEQAVGAAAGEVPPPGNSGTDPQGSCFVPLAGDSELDAADPGSVSFRLPSLAFCAEQICVSLVTDTLRSCLGSEAFTSPLPVYRCLWVYFVPSVPSLLQLYSPDVQT